MNSRASAGLHFVPACELAGSLRTREVSAVDVMQAFLGQIERVDSSINAIPTLRAPDELLAEASAADAALARGDTVGPVHGLPIAVKDLSLTRGLRTTFGSRIFADFVPEVDEIFVERVKRAGGIVIGKTNTPEFGAGSQTFNAVFGATRNPYDLSKTCGGSSGGAAAAVACGMLPFADGTDLGGSLRNPASFCNVVGFRPSPGRVARLAADPWNTLSVQGPIARSVGDVALLLSVMAGPDDRDPISLAEPGDIFSVPLQRDFENVRIAWSEDLGRYPVEPEVIEVLNGSRGVFESLGCLTTDAEPDFSGVDEVFQVLRAADFAHAYATQLEQRRDLLKDTVIWNIERGLELTARDLTTAQSARARIYARVQAFFTQHEFLVLPVAQVVPFPLEIEWVREINGVRMATYIDWMATCYAITCTGLPAVSVPCGFTADGLPIGLQIVGRRQRDLEVLQLAYAFEQATRHGLRRPAVAL